MLAGLRWDPDDFGGVKQIQVRAHGLTGNEDVEIWLPDVQPYNMGNVLSAELERSLAIVNSSGLVYWSRPGVIDLLCKFRGVNAFPRHGGLSCPVDVGGWLMSGI